MYLIASEKWQGHYGLVTVWCRSIKKVRPTIAPNLDYSDLEVGDGVAAKLAWLEATRIRGVPWPVPSSGSASLHLRSTVAKEAIMH